MSKENESNSNFNEKSLKEIVIGVSNALKNGITTMINSGIIEVEALLPLVTDEKVGELVRLHSEDNEISFSDMVFDLFDLMVDGHQIIEDFLDKSLEETGNAWYAFELNIEGGLLVELIDESDNGIEELIKQIEAGKITVEEAASTLAETKARKANIMIGLDDIREVVSKFTSNKVGLSTVNDFLVDKYVTTEDLNTFIQESLNKSSEWTSALIPEPEVRMTASLLHNVLRCNPPPMNNVGALTDVSCVNLDRLEGQNYRGIIENGLEDLYVPKKAGFHNHANSIKSLIGSMYLVFINSSNKFIQGIGLNSLVYNVYDSDYAMVVDFIVSHLDIIKSMHGEGYAQMYANLIVISSMSVDIHLDEDMDYFKSYEDLTLPLVNILELQNFHITTEVEDLCAIVDMAMYEQATKENFIEFRGVVSVVVAMLNYPKLSRDFERMYLILSQLFRQISLAPSYLIYQKLLNKG